MDSVTIEPSKPLGQVVLPPSKSAAHRALICSYLARGGTVKPIIDSQDMMATTNALKALQNGDNIIDCFESGSTLRFIIPIAAALGKRVTFVGSGRLPQRPLDAYLELLPKHGVSVTSEGGLPFTISGQLKAGHYEIAGDISSQYITGLLLALPLLDGDSAIHITTALQSKPYVDMTLSVMESYGVFVRETDFGYLICGNQSYNKIDFDVEGDWSQAAAFMASGAIGGDVTVSGVNMNSLQGDRVICDILKAFGANIKAEETSVQTTQGQLKGTIIDASDIPDMVPALAVTAAFAQGETIIKGAGRLRYKESDRIKSTVENLRAMGVTADETDDGMVVIGASQLNGANLRGYNDHRIVMAFSVAAMFAKGTSTIDDAHSINKSYPSFFEDYRRIGGIANVVCDRS